MKKLYTLIEKVKKSDSEVELKAEIPVEVIATFTEGVVMEMRRDFEMPGFRKGQVPAEIVREKIGEMNVWQEAADAALGEVLPEMIEDNDLKILASPRVTVTKLAPGNPVAFTAHIALVPTITLPDYRKIGESVRASKKDVEVTQAEIDDTITRIQKMRVEPVKKEGENKEEVSPIPELTDEYVRSIGKFESVADFKEKIKNSLKEEKENESRMKLREELAKQLVDKTKITLPASVIEEELAALRTERSNEANRLGLSMEDYLKRMQKTEAEIEQHEKDYVERQFKMRFILEGIAEKEALTVDEKEVEEQAEVLRTRYAEADPAHLKAYVRRLLLNEKVLNLLEGKTEKEVVKE